MKTGFVKLPHSKRSADKQTMTMPLPDRVTISMSQHGGVPCVPLVKPGDEVKTGQLIGDSDAFMSAPVHASISGKVTDITRLMNVFGKYHDAVVIERGEEEKLDGSVRPPEVNGRESFIAAIRASGLVGLGGAGFPTHIKLAFDPNTAKIDTLVINGAECEPYITSDDRTFIENGEAVADGIRLVLKYLEIERAVIGIESNKPSAIKRMKELTENDENISVAVLRSVYPQGAEKVLIQSAVGRTVRAGELPGAAGCLVLNCSTAAFISDYMKTGMPLIKRRVTIDGDAVKEPLNLLVPVGAHASDVIRAAGADISPARAVFGGPMMGQAFYDPETPVTKTCNAITLFSGARDIRGSACIRCGRCIKACAMGLMPTLLEHAYDRRDAKALKKLGVNLCMDCGACSYVCPAKRDLAEKNQLAKIFLRELG